MAVIRIDGNGFAKNPVTTDVYIKDILNSYALGAFLAMDNKNFYYLSAITGHISILIPLVAATPSPTNFVINCGAWRSYNFCLKHTLGVADAPNVKVNQIKITNPDAAIPAYNFIKEDQNLSPVLTGVAVGSLTPYFGNGIEVVYTSGAPLIGAMELYITIGF